MYFGWDCIRYLNLHSSIVLIRWRIGSAADQKGSFSSIPEVKGSQPRARVRGEGRREGIGIVNVHNNTKSS